MKKKSKFISSQGYNPADPKCFEHVEGTSLTVAGEAYTIQELFERHMQGQVVNIHRESYYEDTADFDSIDFQRLKFADPFEKAEMLEDVKMKAQRAIKALNEWKASQAIEDDVDDEGSKPSSKNQKPKAESKRADSEATSEAKRSVEPNVSASETKS